MYVLKPIPAVESDANGKEIKPAELKTYTYAYTLVHVSTVLFNEEEGYGEVTHEEYGYIGPNSQYVYLPSAWDYSPEISVRTETIATLSLVDPEDPENEDYEISDQDLRDVCEEYNKYFRDKAQFIYPPTDLTPEKLRNRISSFHGHESFDTLEIVADWEEYSRYLWAHPGLNLENYVKICNLPETDWGAGYYMDDTYGDSEVLECERFELKEQFLVEWPDASDIKKPEPVNAKNQIINSIRNQGGAYDLLGFLGLKNQLSLQLHLADKSKEAISTSFPRATIAATQTIWAIRSGSNQIGALTLLDRGELAEACYSNLKEFKSSSLASDIEASLAGCEVRQVSITDSIKRASIYDGEGSFVELEVLPGSYTTLAFLQRLPEDQMGYLNWLKDFYDKDDENTVYDFIWDQQAIKPDFLLRAVLVINRDLLAGLPELEEFAYSNKSELITSVSRKSAGLYAAFGNRLLGIYNYLKEPSEVNREIALSKFNRAVPGGNSALSIESENLKRLFFGDEASEGAGQSGPKFAAALAALTLTENWQGPTSTNPDSPEEK